MNRDPEKFSTKAVAQSSGTKDSSIAIWTDALTATIRFYWNKLWRGYFVLDQTAATIGGEGTESSPMRHARAAVGSSSGDLPYYMARDAQGVMRGVQPAWMYLRDFSVVGTQKFAIIRRLLAQLPGGVTFHFAFHIDLPDAALVRQALVSAGFKLLDWQTFTYTPPPGHADLIDALTGKSIKGTLRRARRDLEIVDISVREFFRFQRANLATSGKENSRNDKLDELNTEEALRRKSARILAARRKSTDADSHPRPFDAAAVFLWDEPASVLQFWRLTYRENSNGTNKPHVDASKLLILAAMQEAAVRKMILDTDGYTAGTRKTYALFGPGVFRLATRLHCERECLWGILNRYYPSLARRLGALDLRKSKLQGEVAAPALLK